MKLSALIPLALAVSCFQYAAAVPSPRGTNVQLPFATPEQVTQIMEHIPIVNQIQADLFNAAVKAGKPLMAQEEFAALLKARGGSYQDLVKLVYELQGRAYPDIMREPEVKVKGKVEDYRKLFGMTFFANRSLVQQTDFDRNTMPLFSLLTGPSTISQEVILPTLLKLILGDGIIIPDWLPNLPKDPEVPSDIVGGWIEKPGTAPLNPSVDPFYNPPRSSYTNKPHGQVIAYRAFGPSVEWVNVDRAFQFSFASTDTVNNPIAGTSSVMIPKNPDGKNVFSFLQFVDALGSTCIPTYRLMTGFVDPTINYHLLRNHIMNVPDHGGPLKLFAVGQTEGLVTLDSMLALDNLRSTLGIQYNDHYLFGYSGGSIPVGWALQLHGKYAPSVNIRGAALGGVIGNVTEVASAIDGTIFSGFLPAVLNSLFKQYDGFEEKVTREELRSPAFLNRIHATENYCAISTLLNTIEVKYLDSIFKDGKNTLAHPYVKEVLDAQSMGLQPIINDIPIMIYNGIQDEIAPIESVDEVVDQWCKLGANIDYYRVSGLGHGGSLLLNDIDKQVFFEKVINEGYKPSRCGSWQDATRQTQDKSNKTPLSDMSFDEVKKLVYGDFTEETA